MPGGEHRDRRRRRPRLGGVPDAGPRLAPRLLPARRDAPRRRRVRRPHPAVASTCSRSSPPPDIDVEAWHATIDEIARRAPERLALIHFGVATDVAEPPRAPRRRARPLGRARRAAALDARAVRRRGARRTPAPTPTLYDAVAPVRPVVAGPAPLLGEARERAWGRQRDDGLDSMWPCLSLIVTRHRVGLALRRLVVDRDRDRPVLRDRQRAAGRSTSFFFPCDRARRSCRPSCRSGCSTSSPAPGA